ncbi:hypothetical protein NM208_g2795 [Fusarium decemcellulare]|uniref:Uncharacterized protein n=1 Tax=Fusarium decemcellulare TaxID=57161 RepID=A0ACC1SR89_9HYPO|nr:hypothetical protein NM208_g2795 [Fusarium decemcellulare]
MEKRPTHSLETTEAQERQGRTRSLPRSRCHTRRLVAGKDSHSVPSLCGKGVRQEGVVGSAGAWQLASKQPQRHFLKSRWVWQPKHFPPSWSLPGHSLLLAISSHKSVHIHHLATSLSHTTTIAMPGTTGNTIGGSTDANDAGVQWIEYHNSQGQLVAVDLPQHNPSTNGKSHKPQTGPRFVSEMKLLEYLDPQGTVIAMDAVNCDISGPQDRIVATTSLGGVFIKTNFIADIQTFQKLVHASGADNTLFVAGEMN